MKVNPDNYDMKCKLCKKSMDYEANVFVLNWFCDNPKCKAYLKRSKPYQKNLFGNIEVGDNQNE